MKDRIIIFCGNYGSGKTEIAFEYRFKVRFRAPGRRWWILI